MFLKGGKHLKNGPISLTNIELWSIHYAVQLVHTL